MAIVVYNDNGTIKVVKFGTRIVSTDADPVGEKQWVFLHGAAYSSGTSIQHELTGILEPDEPGCGSSIVFCEELTSLFNPNDRAIGTRAAIRRNSVAGGSTCDTWAIFEVQVVDADPVPVIGNYVRFVSASTRTITPKYTNSGITLQYSVDNGATWTTITSGSETTGATEHWFRGQAAGTKTLFTSRDTSNAWAFSDSSNLKVYGNLNFLLCDTFGSEIAPTSLDNYCYSYMFANCTSLTKAPELPATTLGDYCYRDMFNGCTSLTVAPELPATTLGDYCYFDMFYGCTSLTVAPELPATTLGDYCYFNMFYGCTLLTTAPELLATALATDCYSGMFNGCTSLTTAPELPATTLGKSCYNSMFYNCTSLTTAPELLATTLATHCYDAMFRGCTSLTTAPELPATTLAEGCYSDMFYGCTSLTTAPKLPATTLVNYCYSNMFNGCSAFKVSSTKIDSYTYAWRIPTSGTGAEATSWNTDMLKNTGGTFTDNPTINTTYYIAQDTNVTAKPTVGTPDCMIINGVSTLRVSVTNNDDVAAVIRHGSTILGTLNPGASTTYDLSDDTGFELPYVYNVIINATATGKTVSSSVRRAGTITYCLGSEV